MTSGASGVVRLARRYEKPCAILDCDGSPSPSGVTNHPPQISKNKSQIEGKHLIEPPFRRFEKLQKLCQIAAP